MIGNFDGCHLGHQALIKSTLTHASVISGHSTAVTFTPRPESWLRGIKDEPRLFTVNQKIRTLQAFGIDHVITIRFDDQLKHMTHEEFFFDHLIGDLNCKALIVGGDFHFGKDRLGNTQWLRQACAQAGVNLDLVPEVAYNSKRISSSTIRQLLQCHGQVDEAKQMMGRPYMLEGLITKGAQMGRKIGFPTANLAKVDQLIPKTGVYAGHIWLESFYRQKSGSQAPPLNPPSGDVFPAVFNIGYRPTVQGSGPPKLSPILSIEGHLINFKAEFDSLYDLRAGFYLEWRLRDEQKFADLETLKLRITQDIKEALALLA